MHNRSPGCGGGRIRPRGIDSRSRPRDRRAGLSGLCAGKDKGILSAPQYQAVAALLEAGPRGLSLEGMNQKCGNKKGWRQVLLRLRRDSEWAKVIAFPGGGYPGKESNLYRTLSR